MYTSFKLVHLCAAILSFNGFVLRGYWMMTDPILLERKWVRIVPHIIDAIFLVSGIGLIFALRLQLLQNGWLLTKFAALLAYVICGSIALRRGRSMPIRQGAFALAVLSFIYIVGVALSKSTASWLAWPAM